MKILVVCQYYAPEPFQVTDVCEELVRRGNEVLVVTGTPNYPTGDIYPGYERGLKADEVLNGVRIHRCPIHPRKRGAFHRLWNYLSYPMKSKSAVKKIIEQFDVVFIYQLSPVLMAQAGILYARLHGIKAVLYCLDLWPASLCAGGVRGGIIYRLFGVSAKKIYCSVDRLLISSKSFSSYFLQQFGLSDTHYLPQYAEENFSIDKCRKVPDGHIDLMFAGNVGIAQSVETIIKAASLCKEIRNLRWHIVGDGVALQNCRKMAASLGVNIIFHGRRSLSEMPRYYAMADAMLITMKKGTGLEMTLPRKVQSYMAAGKPLIGAIDGEANFIIKEAACGFCCGAEDAEGLASNVLSFVNCEKKTELAENAVLYSRQHFSKEKFIDSLEQHFREAVQ